MPCKDLGNHRSWCTASSQEQKVIPRRRRREAHTSFSRLLPGSSLWHQPLPDLAHPGTVLPRVAWPRVTGPGRPGSGQPSSRSWCLLLPESSLGLSVWVTLLFWPCGKRPGLWHGVPWLHKCLRGLEGSPLEEPSLYFLGPGSLGHLQPLLPFCHSPPPLKPLVSSDLTGRPS